MNTMRQTIRLLSMASAITFFMFGWPITMAASPEGLKVSLSGDQEVPPVTTSASANGTITVSPNKSVSGSITVSGMQPTAAHIHEGAQGENGAVIIPLTKSSDNTWAVPAGAKLTDAQYKSYLAGNLYVNVHSAAHKGGEIRAQLSPK
jgi:CHRD domain